MELPIVGSYSAHERVYPYVHIRVLSVFSIFGSYICFDNNGHQPSSKFIIELMTFTLVPGIFCFDSSSTVTLRRLHVRNSSFVACIACTYIFVYRRVPFVWLPELINHLVTPKMFKNKAKFALYGELFETIVACWVLVHIAGFLSNQKKAFRIQINYRVVEIK